jgi:3-hydroxyisobutyrate dehydrogenase-like beta-hydroxyacid dehydrogenase
MTREETVGVIGLGIMGGAIARNLVRKGYRVVGFDLDPHRSKEAQETGVTITKSAGAVGAAADRVLTSLPSHEALDQTARALADLPESERQGLVVAELSTLSLECKVRGRDVLADCGVVLLDCPLSGTGAQAAVGDLVVYASGDAPAFARCEDVFAGFARATRYLGEFGIGTKMKLVANLLVAVHNVAAAEAIHLGVRAGLDPTTLCEVLGSGAGSSRVFDLRAPLMVREEYAPATMKLDVWKKDMTLIRGLAESCGVATPLFSATEPLYDAAVAAGHGHEDTAAVYEALKALGRRAEQS